MARSILWGLCLKLFWLARHLFTYCQFLAEYLLVVSLRPVDTTFLVISGLLITKERHLCKRFCVCREAEVFCRWGNLIVPHYYFLRLWNQPCKRYWFAVLVSGDALQQLWQYLLAWDRLLLWLDWTPRKTVIFHWRFFELLFDVYLV